MFANSEWTANGVFLETAARPPVIHGWINEKIFHVPENQPERMYDVLTYGSTRMWKGAKLAEEICRRAGVTLKKFGDNSRIPQNKLHEEYAKAKVYLSASWYEGWNWPVLEAMACGTPVVMTSDGGSDDYAKDGWNCIKIPPRGTTEGEKAIREVLGNRKLWESLRKRGLETAEQMKKKTGAEKFIEEMRRIHGQTTKN
jgi:glycosyltransferase involved in cell wall biosynthesis